MNLKKKLIFLVIFVMLSGALYFVYRRNSSKRPNSKDLSGGAVVQRERIDRAIDTASKLDSAEAIDSLHRYSESYEVAQLASLSPASFGNCYLKQVLADRRVSKIFAHLQSIPAEDASQEASNIFDAKLPLLESEWMMQADGKSDGIGNLGPLHHATSVAAFFCSYFCSPALLDEKLKRWDLVVASTAINQIPGVELMAINRFIDPLFRLNLLVISGSRNGASINELNAKLDLITRKITGDPEPFLQVKTVNLFRWNAETLDTDFTHVTRSVPASANSILLELPGFPDPNSSLFLQDKQVCVALEKTIETWRTSGGNN